jgi:hypothetical protein
MSDFDVVMSSPITAYDEALAFFRGNGIMNRTLLRIAADLDRHGIDYAVIGAIALNQYGYKRFTEDIDLLMTREGLEQFREKLVGLGYRPAFEGAKKKFKTSEENVPVEIVTTGEYPGDGKPKSVQFPNPIECCQEIEGVKTITLEKLVELKLASGMTAADRLKDLADVQELIKIKKLGAEFAVKLDESVRGKYLELFQSVQNAEDAEFDSEG